MEYNTEEDLKGAGGKKSKKKLNKLGFEPQITLKKMPHITQSSGKGCPTACAAMILNYAGINISYKELQKKTFYWREMTEPQLRSLIESYSIKTIPLKDLEDAKKVLENGRPLLVYVMRPVYARGGMHWIVLRGVKGNVFAVSHVLFA